MKFFLTIDDDKNILEVYRHLIKRIYDAEVDCACNGKEALEKIQLFEYDVILSDIEMPVMNGAELYREIKEKNPAIVSKMAFISGNVHGTDAISIKEEGIPLLAKPFIRQDLTDIINSIIASQSKTLLPDMPNRSYPRYTASEDCMVEPFLEIDLSKQIEGKAVNYSEGGICISYKGEEIHKEAKVKITVDTLEIFEKDAQVVWSRTLNRASKAGLKWIS